MRKIKCLVDADLLTYECASVAQYKDKSGEWVAKSFDCASTALDNKIKEILEETESTEEPTLYLTQDRSMYERDTKRLAKKGVGTYAIAPYTPNFREGIAVTKPYKGNRQSEKPYHYDNIREYIRNMYDCKLAVGMEADDLISIDHNIEYEDYETVLCSRDKDLRITPGLHYGWGISRKNAEGEVIKGKPFGPKMISRIVYLDEPKSGTLKGGGLKFFYSQLITGDTVDNIGGLPRKGGVFAYKLLKDCETEEELFQATYGAYCDHFNVSDSDSEKDCIEYFKEQAGLLWMIQQLDEDGELVHYEFPLDKVRRLREESIDES